MTLKQQRMIDKLKRYFDNEDEYNYKTVARLSMDDPVFEKYIQSMTVDRIAGRTALAKNNYRDKFVYKGG